MSYIKTNWKTGDVITADKLNNIEGGIENIRPIPVTLSGDGQSIIFTYNDFRDAFDSGRQFMATMGGQQGEMSMLVYPAFGGLMEGQYIAVLVTAMPGEGGVEVSTFSASAPDVPMTIMGS